MSFSRNKGFKTTGKRLHHKVLEIPSCNGGKHKKYEGYVISSVKESQYVLAYIELLFRISLVVGQSSVALHVRDIPTSQRTFN